MHFVEFLEMVGRVAVTYWQINKESIEEVPLAKKIEFVIDQIFRIIKKKRISVNADLESESETDDDYWTSESKNKESSHNSTLK